MSIGIFFTFWYFVPRKIWQPCISSDSKTAIVYQLVIRLKAEESETIRRAENKGGSPGNGIEQGKVYLIVFGFLETKSFKCTRTTASNT
jgi:hypothetical protein